MSRSASARRWRAVPPSAARPGVPRSTAFAALRAGESQAVVLLGEPGAGKTALLKDLAERASGFRVVNISGVQSEMELAFAALHQLCAPLLAVMGGADRGDVIQQGQPVNPVEGV